MLDVGCVTGAKKWCKDSKRMEQKPNLKHLNGLGASCLLLILVVIVTAVIAGLITLIGCIVYQEMSLVYLDTLEHFSAPCDDLSLSADEDLETFDIKRRGLSVSVNPDGRYSCSNTNITRLIRLVVERKSRVRFASGLDGPKYYSCGNESFASKPGHQLVAFSKLATHQYSSDANTEAILQWDIHSKNSYINKSVHYQDGTIIIPEGRTYHIYASVHFNISKSFADVANFNTLYRYSVKLCKNIHDYEETILARTMLFNVSSSNVVSSLRIGAILRMSKNDKIYIKVSNANLLLRDSIGNSFGLFPT